MTDLTRTAAQVAAVYPEESEIFDMILAATIGAGQAVRQDTAGKAALTDANAGSGAEKFRGLCLRSRGAGQAASILRKGAVYGFDLSGLAYDAPVYLSDTAGALSDTPSTTNPVPVGRVMAVPDASLTKVLWIDASGGWVRPALAGGVFVSTEQTADGTAQSIAHGLGVIPRFVVVTVTELPDAAAETGFDIAEGTHTTTNVVVTVTNTLKYKVTAYA